MKMYLDAVEAFHLKMGVSAKCKFPTSQCNMLEAIGDLLGIESQTLESHVKEYPRLLRAHLMVEELGETLQAMGAGDEVTALDGLTDLLYVLLGTAVTFDWPLESAFAEVHISNMTKGGDDGSGRVRNKGENFEGPNIEKILQAHKNAPRSTKTGLLYRLGENILERLHAARKDYALLDQDDKQLIDRVCTALSLSRSVASPIREKVKKALEKYKDDIDA